MRNIQHGNRGGARGGPQSEGFQVVSAFLNVENFRSGSKNGCNLASVQRFCRLNQINMADAANKYSDNVDGKLFVDDQCIDCDLCRETAPANFKRNDDGGHSYVYKQPESPEEEALCQEAMDGCPVEAIGNDA